jgi:hypothetical protein
LSRMRCGLGILIFDPISTILRSTQPPRLLTMRNLGGFFYLKIREKLHKTSANV